MDVNKGREKTYGNLKPSAIAERARLSFILRKAMSRNNLSKTYVQICIFFLVGGLISCMSMGPIVALFTFPSLYLILTFMAWLERHRGRSDNEHQGKENREHLL